MTTDRNDGVLISGRIRYPRRASDPSPGPTLREATAAAAIALLMLTASGPATARPSAPPGASTQPLDALGNPVPVPAAQPRFPKRADAGRAAPGQKITAGTTLDQLKRQAQRAQGRADGKPAPGSACVGHPGRLQPAHCTVAAHHRHGDAAPAPQAVTVGLAVPTAVQGPTNLSNAVGGRWQVGPTQPSANIHSVVLNTGKVLMIAGSSNQWDRFAAGQFTSVLWNPADNSFKAIATPYDMFCAGHVILRDGRVLVAGGTVAFPVYDASGNLAKDWRGSRKSYIFDPIKEIYEPTGDMNVGRWYPTMTRLGNDTVVAVAGLDDGSATVGGHDTPVNELFTPTPGSTWDVFRGGSWTALNQRQFPQYAHMILRDDGKLFYTGQSTANNGQMPGIWDPATNTFQEVPGLPYRWQRNAGGSILLPPAQNQKVMVFAGGDYQLPSLNDTHVVDLKSPAPSYLPGPPIANPKMYVGAVILPDYTVLQTNGASRFREDAVRDAQIYNPQTNTWTTVNSPSIDRLYHSTAFLLPDGRIATAGSQVIAGANEMRIEVFEPPYLFKGQRPAITAGPTWVSYDQGTRFTWDVTKAAGSTITKMSLLRPSATTHSTDTEQRLIDLPFTQSGTTVSTTIPINRNLTPPGWYMLTVVDNLGRPSIAKWVSLN
jgi:hypothetical protein